MKLKKINSYSCILCLSIIGFFVSVFMSLVVGSVKINIIDLISDISHNNISNIYKIFVYVRLPRVIASILAGMALSVSGLIIQTVLANSLAGPNIIGINAGAGLCTALCYAFFPENYAIVPIAGFFGAIISVLFVYVIAKKTGSSRINIILIGVAINSFLSAGIKTINTIFPDAMLNSSYFNIGGLSGVTIKKIMPAGIYIVIAIVVVFLFSVEMDIIGLGDDTAKSLGLNAEKYRFILLLLSAVLAGAAVSFVGLLGFVGLIIPHIARFFVGTESRKLIPICLILGATFTNFCDLLSRVLFSPYELPTGIIMSAIGAPVFVWLIIKRKNKL